MEKKTAQTLQCVCAFMHSCICVRVCVEQGVSFTLNKTQRTENQRRAVWCWAINPVIVVKPWSVPNDLTSVTAWGPHSVHHWPVSARGADRRLHSTPLQLPESWEACVWLTFSPLSIKKARHSLHSRAPWKTAVLSIYGRRLELLWKECRNLSSQK